MFVKPFIVPGSPLIVTFPALTSPVVESSVICFDSSVPNTTLSANLISKCFPPLSFVVSVSTKFCVVSPSLVSLSPPSTDTVVCFSASVLTECNCAPFTASFDDSFTSPAAKFVIFFSFMSIPVLFITGPSLIVTLSTVISLFNITSIFESDALVVILLSPNTSNLMPLSLFKFCVSVSEFLSPPNLIVLLPNAFIAVATVPAVAILSGFVAVAFPPLVEVIGLVAKLTLYMSCPFDPFVGVPTTIGPVPVTSVFAAFAAVSNWSLFTASVPFFPGETFVIGLLFIFNPSLFITGPLFIVILSTVMSLFNE